MGATRPVFATTFALAFSLSTNAADATKPPAARRNVLVLIADDLGQAELGCYGHPTIRTPNIDGLAASGVRFTNAFATTASCSASRSVLYTGLHNHANGQYGHAHGENNFRLLPAVETVFSLVARNGYRTGLVGKRHVGPDEKFVLDFQPRVNARDPNAIGAKVREFLAAPDERPFLLVVGFVDPHRAQTGYGNPPASADERLAGFAAGKIPVPPFLPDLPETRRELDDYCRAIERLDQGVGRVLAALADHQTRAAGGDDTLVVFLSDNGMPFPGAKTNLYEPGIRLPLIARRAETRNRECPALVSFTDITPTILDWTRSAPPNYALHGKSILPLVEGTTESIRKEVYLSHTFHEITMYYPMRGIRTERYKLIWNIAHPLPFPPASDLFASPTWQAVLSTGQKRYGARAVERYLQRDEYELYDLEHDDNETKNLAQDPPHAELRADLARRLREFQVETNDPWLVRYQY